MYQFVTTGWQCYTEEGAETKEDGGGVGGNSAVMDWEATGNGTPLQHLADQAKLYS